ncbi:MAG: fibronectin type III domain-containing protein, partial [Kiritimatiellae bacterium]|nr:fibronectin type III domain-containing protein [Kiritimatiellia bacterium]
MRLQPARHVTAVAALAAMLYWLWDAAGYAAERLLFEDFEETDNVVGRVWTHYAEQFAGSADRWQVAGFAQSGSYCVASMDPNELDNQGDSILRFNIGLNWGQEMFIRYHARFPADWEAEATDYNNGGHGPDGGSNHFRMEGEDNRDIEATFGGGWLHGGSFHWYDSGVRWDSGRLYVYDNAWHEYALYIKMPSSPTASNGMFRAWRDGAGTYAANAVLAYTGMQQTTVFTRVSVGSPCYYKGPVRPTQVDGKQSSGNWRFWIDSYEVWNGIPSEPPPPVTPAAPSELNAVPVSSSKIELTWRDNSSDETGFKIDRRQSGQSGWARVAEPAANVTAHPDSGLPADTTFYYIVKACNAAGNSAYSDLAWATTERAAPSTIVIPAGATWRYRKGTAEASEPSTAWRRPGFDDSSWSSGPAPIGYSDYGVTLGTELADMPNSYSCIFLRSGFSVRYSALVSELHILAQFDDSFIMWINGEEIARVNAPGAPGEPVPHDAIALNNMNASWSNTYAGAAMPVLCPTNVLAVQVFNRSLT